MLLSVQASAEAAAAAAEVQAAAARQRASGADGRVQQLQGRLKTLKGQVGRTTARWGALQPGGAHYSHTARVCHSLFVCQ